jgi:signal transduction histidine kinase
MTKPNNVDFSLVLASSVHDMKNSIGMLIASLESCIEEFPPTNQKQGKHFNTLHYEASRINSELVQLLTIYRMQNNHLPLRVDQHYVIDVLEDQLARNHSLLESRGVNPRLECDDSLEWFFDADLVGSVVQNVIVNCSRYTRAELLVSAKVEDDFLRIIVADDGSGYPPSMLEAPGMLVQNAEVSEGNTHLGLYFAEQIARLHKQKNRVGYIRLENGAPLGGGCFNLILP